MSKLLIATAVGAVALVGGTWISAPVETKNATEPASQETVAPEQQLFPSYTIAKSTVKDCEKRAPLYKSERVFQLPNPAEVDARLMQAFSAPSAMLSKADVDPDANIALFHLAASCQSARKPGRDSTKVVPYGCPDLSSTLPIRMHPIEFLQKAAEQGSIEAKFMYALNAPTVAAQFQNSGSPQDLQFAASVIALGEEYGIDAARAGHPQAYRYMSNAYEQGKFGVPDLQQAYAFALPLQMIGGAEDKKYILRLLPRITEQQRVTANEFAFGCLPSTDHSTFANPFG